MTSIFQDLAVQKFLEEIKGFDNEKFQILEKLRSIVFEINPKVSEKIMYGGVMFGLEKNFGGLFVSQKHVSFEFSKGFLFDDPENFLEGSGKYRRHLKFKTLKDVDRKTVDLFVEQAVSIT